MPRILLGGTERMARIRVGPADHLHLPESANTLAIHGFPGNPARAPMAGLGKVVTTAQTTGSGRLRKFTALANSSMLLATGGSDGAEALHFQSRIIDRPAKHHAVLFVMMQYPPRQVPALAWHDGTITSHITSLE